jgi:hypothetical protein
MAKRKREFEAETDIICNYNEVEETTFNPKVEILTVDADSSLLAPKASLPAKMLPRHLQKRKGTNPNKNLTETKTPSQAQPVPISPDPISIPGLPVYPPPNFYPNPMSLPISMPLGLPNSMPLANPGFLPYPGGFVQPMTYYGEVPLQPPQPKQEKPKAKVHVKKILRSAGGEIWEDSTLAEWSKDDYRLFVGNLGHEVTDDGLKRAFMQYKSLNKARVVHDKRNDKSRGFGFVSFLDPQDFIRALKEMNGKYVGNRPCKLSKSRWDERSLETSKPKKEEKQMEKKPAKEEKK